MIDKPRLKKGEGKVQYYACREQVAQLLEAGYSIRAIYDRMVKDGAVSSSYKGFYQNIMRDRDSAGKEVKSKSPQVLGTIQPATVPPVAMQLPRPQAGNTGWSLDQKVASLNVKAAQSGKKHSNSELSEFDESEVL
jgi:hypothetical protein